MYKRLLALLMLILFTGPLIAQDKVGPLDRAELDKRIASIIYGNLTVGVDLFNSGNQEGCFRLYQGTVMTLIPLLDHRPALVTMANTQLAAAKNQRAAEGAFTLRKILDDIRNDVGNKKKALWDRLGGEEAVRAVVKDFVLAAAPDPKVNFFRNGKYKIDDAGVVKLQQQLVELISTVSGGPLKYSGRSMKESHSGMKITEDEFNALAGHLVATLKKYKVPQAEIDELVGIVASTKKDIVELK